MNTRLFPHVPVFSAVLPAHPAVHSSIYYALPYSREIVAAFFVSASLHAGLLLSIHRPPIEGNLRPVEKPSVFTPPNWTPVTLDRTPEKAPLEQTKTPEEAKPKEQTHASIPDTLMPESRGAVSMVINQPSPFVRPVLDGSGFGLVPNGPLAETGFGPARTEKIFNLVDLDKQPEALHQLAPVYPHALRIRRVEGLAVIRFIVDPRGAVAEAVAVRTTDREFGASAVEAVLKWKFKAGKKDGRAVNTLMEVPIKFNLADDA